MTKQNQKMMFCKHILIFSRTSGRPLGDYDFSEYDMSDLEKGCFKRRKRKAAMPGDYGKATCAKYVSHKMPEKASSAGVCVWTAEGSCKNNAHT